MIGKNLIVDKLIQRLASNAQLLPNSKVMLPELTNEADVREDFLAPLLKLLGYQRGSPNDILREKHLSYPKVQFGRKKASDPPLAGRADYILSVAGVGRWVVEAKPPDVAVSVDDIEQALTYARHPEISAVLCLISNGSETHIYNSSSSAEEGAVFVSHERDPDELSNQLRHILSPRSFSLRFRPKLVAGRSGIAVGFPEKCEIVKGTATYRRIEWSANISLPPPALAQMRNLEESLVDFVSHIETGNIYLNEGRVCVATEWSMGNRKMEQTADAMGFNREIEFVSNAMSISTLSEQPTYFDGFISADIKPGELVFADAFDPGLIPDLRTSVAVAARAKGFLEGNVVSGEFYTEYLFEFPDMPMLRLEMEGVGDFSLRID